MKIASAETRQKTVTSVADVSYTVCRRHEKNRFLSSPRPPVVLPSIQAVAQAKAEAAPKDEERPQEPEEEVQVAPDGFEMVEINGRMVLRMK